MTPAPPLDCAACAQTIGKWAGHNLTDDLRVLCSRCLFRRDLHRTFWPDCPLRWHDVFDHTKSVASTRAGVVAALGLWPTPKASSDDRDAS